jgi:hypothetical protein
MGHGIESKEINDTTSLALPERFGKGPRDPNSHLARCLSWNGPRCFSLISNSTEMNEMAALQAFFDFWPLGSVFFPGITLIFGK